ncbi:MAG TPA: amidohydrolase family protein [Gemmatimonadales bacterium]|nr:amidohydrolase family protein [Gemmatimonadales bacterium]
MKLQRLAALAFLGFLAAYVPLSPLPAQEQGPFDILIRGGHLIDGSGNPWFSADVGIRAGKIVAVGKLTGATATRTIDARGKTVTPGFIDLHSHGSEGLESDDARRRAAPNVVTQGVTTVVINPDGGGPVAIGGQKATLERLGIGLNAILMIPHNSVRREVLGTDFQRTATPAEITRMRALVRRGMEEGAVGLSAGLEYVPGIWSDTDELVALVEEVLPYDGFFHAHERSGGFVPMWWRPALDDPAGVGAKKLTMVDWVNELIQVGERTGARVHFTHMKARGDLFWGSSQAAISLINRARARGVRFTGDQYPYTTSGSDGNVSLIPAWAVGEERWGGDRNATPDYREALRKTLADPSKARGLRRDIEHEVAYRGGAENIIVFDHPDRSYIGKSVAELAAAKGQTPTEFAISMQLEGLANRRGGARVRAFSFSEEDIDAFAAQPWVATASDGGIALPEDGPTTHARYYGTFPRKIRRYALERGVLSVESAVRAGTSLPAQILGLRNRGLVMEGFGADLVVMNLERVRDMSTFENPHQFAQGIDYVLVNGKFVVDGEGKPTGALAGVVITRAQGRVPPSLP